MSNSALALYLHSPMQAWGVTSRFQRRETEAYPTKSGVLGLLAAALGYDKNAEEEASHLENLAQLSFSVFQVVKPGLNVQRLSDFHTVGGGFSEMAKVDPVARMSMSNKANGAFPNTVVTHRTYLTDARFLAVLEGDPALVQICHDALLNPVWGVWFGRKCCFRIFRTRVPSSRGLMEMASNAAFQEVSCL